MARGIDPRTRIGAVRLAVRDLDAVRGFYERSIGLRELEGSGAELARLGPDGGPALVELESSPDAPPRPPGTTGLFHLAILVPTRSDLAAALQRVGDSGWRFTGASDHLVSEALYLNDPEGNGIEIYRDRPREEWDWVGDQVRMATIPLDVQGVLVERSTAPTPAPDAGSDPDRPRPPQRRRPRRHGGVLRARGARPRRHRPRLPRRPVHVGGRLPPPRRRQHVGRRRRAPSPTRRARPALVRDRRRPAPRSARPRTRRATASGSSPTARGTRA